VCVSQVLGLGALGLAFAAILGYGAWARQDQAPGPAPAPGPSLSRPGAPRRGPLSPRAWRWYRRDPLFRHEGCIQNQVMQVPE
jgi:hypothetical protein